MVGIASSSGYEPQFLCLVLDGNTEIRSNCLCEVGALLGIVVYPPRVIPRGKIARHGTLKASQIVAVAPCLGIGEADNLGGSESWRIGYSSAACHGHEHQKE